MMLKAAYASGFFFFATVQVKAGNLRNLQTANPCTSCSSCVAVANPSQGGISDAVCAPCAGGQTWWPCNAAPAQCQCGGDITPAPTHAASTPAPTFGVSTPSPTPAGDSSPCNGCSSCVAVANPSQGGISDAVCAPCAGGQTWWPCNAATAQCQCGGDITPAPTPAASTLAPTADESTPAPTLSSAASGCCVYMKPNPCSNSATCVTINGGELEVEPSFCSDDAPNEFNCPLTPVASDLCPTSLVDESQWHYDENMWGKSGATDEQLKIGMRNAACVWAAVCQGNEACLSRCPVAMGIAGMESLFNPSATAADGGYGLWQVGGPSAPSTGVGLSEADAKNPLILGKWVRQVTNQGEYFSPKHRCWSTCEGTLCNPHAQSGWENGWVASWATTPLGGAKSYSEASAVGEACTAAIQNMYPSLSWTTGRFTQRGSCMVGEQVTVDPQR